MGHTKVTTTKIYTDFQISILEFDFLSISYILNQPVFDNGDTNLWNTNREYLPLKLYSIKLEVASSSLAIPTLIVNTTYLLVKLSPNQEGFLFIG